ncbi:succinylglutamate desuccinylase/aspartoacylase family protein [Phaeodactylibacter luteus]|uniref:Succinylglutamate desuccinylase/aspartoacylase family protein n=1 Tax=Phaeodactylibacter luteus TaxID=1564516 RepID=A0A5C6RWY5_9BACT|nr:succinylglutamate desuccinylase/aspartoacylase family protein [Phaeodactylibacter luteus]TXB66329.1 succinylglutamate desuccinylase/aspartoacylase family protein [Phaeodactylibacter luteus]
MEPTFTALPDDAPVIRELDLEEVPAGETRRFWLHLVTDGMGLPVFVPVIVAKGAEAGPVVGLTAAVHGNELNGIPVIQRLFREVKARELRGTLVGVPVVNLPSLLRKKRRFIDGTDLNHIMPGKPDGNVSQVYAYRIVNWIVRKFDYLLDLHTASFGRVNSYYIRADMNDPVTQRMAMLQNAQIIVHNPPSDGTLRGAADALGIHAITLEVGNPNTFQKGHIRSGLTGIHNLLIDLGMTDGDVEAPEKPAFLCQDSGWLYTDTGGILTVHPTVTEQVRAGQEVAILRNIFGDHVKTYRAPADGVVIGKSVSPINQTGGRILHLGLYQ